MKKVIGVLALCLTLTGCNGDKKEPEAEVKAESQTAQEQVQSAEAASQFASFNEKLSYSVGLDIGKSLKNLGDDILLASVYEGMQDIINDKEAKMTVEEVAAVQKEFAEKMQAKQQQELEDMKKKNLEDGKKFLEINGAREGVTVTESGLQYEVLTQGDGPKPAADDIVKVHYVGTLIDGTEFDSSYKRNEPAVFGLNQVIPGWSEGVQLMNVGSKYKLVLPPEISYGENGAPPVIEPNSVLVFEVELQSIETPEKDAIAEDAVQEKMEEVVEQGVDAAKDAAEEKQAQ